MARKKAAPGAVEDETSVAVEETEEPVVAVGAEESVEFVEDEPGEASPRTEDGSGTRSETDRGDGQRPRKKTPEEIEEENRNLKAALKEQRSKGRRLKDDLDAERERAEKASREAATKREQESRDAKRKRLEDVEEIGEAAQIIEQVVTEEHIEPKWLKQRADHLTICEKFARREYKDYDRVLRDAGIEDAITIDPATNRPKDPVMWRRLVIDEPDPAEAAYALAKEILAERAKAGAGRVTEERALEDEDTKVLDETNGDRAAGRREVIERMETAARRPVGIRTLSTARGAEPKRQLTRRDIDAMSDEEYDRLPEHVKREFLSGKER